MVDAGPPRGRISATFLTDRGQTGEFVAELLAGRLRRAARSLDIAIYDLALDGEPGDVVRRAVHDARARGVTVRMVFNQERRRTRPLPPPGFVDHDYVRSLGIVSRAIPGEPDLMHHKYVVSDAGTPAASVWTGSTNWTADSWTREENIVLQLDDPGIADCYLADFEELWETRTVHRTGRQPHTWSEPEPGLRVRAYFTPAGASHLVHEIAQRIATARRRVRVCSPVLTSGPVLASLAEALARPGLDLVGCYDRTQMHEVMRQWARRPESSWKRQAWETIRAGMRWGAKRSVPYSPGSVHDFMHAKCLVADDTVFAGSFNFSHSGEGNAENVLEIESPSLAGQFAAFVDLLASDYAERTPAGPLP
ncbi:MAG TPA: phospholipase D-like domain-containing protein [Candidatus Dormibacteraeota bacterium]|jgi:phosphatidylserine/phosphatidylglycerophosphate/cardiolipin synthase-like enzyme